MDRKPPRQSSASPPPTSSGTLFPSSSPDFAGDETPVPDPRWPSKCRWSVPLKSKLVKASSSGEPESQAVTSSGSLVSGHVSSLSSPTTSTLAGESLIPSSPSVIKVPTDPEVISAAVLPVLTVEDEVAEILPQVETCALSAGQSSQAGDLAKPLPTTLRIDGTGPEVVLNEPLMESAVDDTLAEMNQPEVDLVKADSANGGNPPDGNQNSSQPPPLKGAWTKKLKFLPISELDHSQQTRGQYAVSKPVTAEDDVRFPWAAKMNPSSRNLYRAVEPEYLEDGTPKVTIPPHVLLEGLENQKEYVLGQFFRCSPPPGGLIYAVFNKLWGRKCKISIRKLGVSSYLFHIPEESTRNWVLQRGLWHVDDCLMFVAPWIPKASLAIPEIKTIPVWVTLKNIPSILYSIRGISHIASGLGAPMATHKPRLNPFFMGEAKILVEVELSKAFPPRIAADDKNGVIWMVDVEYAWLPSTCSRCGQLGHKVRRCLQSGESSVVEEVNETHSNVLATTIAVANTTPQLAPTKTTTTSPPNESPPSVPVFKVNDPPATQTIVQELESSPLSVLSGLRSYSAVVSQALPTPSESLLATTTAIVSTTQSTTHPTIISEEAIESPTLGAASPLIVTTDITAQEKLTPHLDRQSLIEPDLGSNRFASLGSPEEEEDSSDSDQASEPADPLTPAGKRILRDRPVKPTTKAKEMHWQSTARGRGHRGRGGRG